MTSTELERQGEASSSRFDLRVLLAFFAIYVLWGTTFLAIRIAVQEVPPLLAAGVRFFVAGVVLFGLMRAKGVAAPSRLQWRNLAIIGVMMFTLEYGPLFWRRGLCRRAWLRCCWRRCR